ncbi:hypothetical protein EJ06DRAFT_164216 [Trichodelitschia bisporula]|uniref:Uncharacterized protein n=1 Tax=Trichodelitschia bisporula TaxID=703511 RepID=A0A6G1HMF3_9PEZI|nr:hypothetical protein EJ06DRAFT_164216 [Trichodelitschia bisporula]
MMVRYYFVRSFLPSVVLSPLLVLRPSNPSEGNSARHRPECWNADPGQWARWFGVWGKGRATAAVRLRRRLWRVMGKRGLRAGVVSLQTVRGIIILLSSILGAENVVQLNRTPHTGCDRQSARNARGSIFSSEFLTARKPRPGRRIVGLVSPRVCGPFPYHRHPHADNPMLAPRSHVYLRRAFVFCSPEGGERGARRLNPIRGNSRIP